MDPIEPKNTEVLRPPSKEVESFDDGFLLGEGIGEAVPSQPLPVGITTPITASESAPLPETEAVSAPEAVRIPDRMYFRIGDVAELVGVKPYVLRYWETEFPMISPQKSSTGQRVYRRIDVETVLLIKHLLYRERYSIEGARKRIQELRREGKLKSFKREKVMGGEETVSRLERFKKAREIVRELNDLVHLPMRELFRY